MDTDLFNKLSAKDRLYQWMKKENRPIRTSEILAWGVKNYSNRADRNARQLASEFKICRMPERKKIMYFGNVKEEIWEIRNPFNPPFSR